MFEKDDDYRKARKESKDRITKVIKAWCAREEVIHDKGFEQGAEFGYNKANEWHFVKDGDLPKEEKEYLAIYESDHTKYIGIESYYPDTKEWSTICKIIAWKEIVFPKEIAE